MNVLSVKWFHLFSVYLFIFIFWWWTNKNITLLCNNILGFLSWLGILFPCLPGLCYFSLTIEGLPHREAISFLVLHNGPFPFIGKSVSCQAQEMSLWSDHGGLCKGTKLHYAPSGVGYSCFCHLLSWNQLYWFPKHHETNFSPGRAMGSPSYRSSSSVHGGFAICLANC